mmetsp:Transcript_876/g.2308  ORF Transcript_876/g.2308 Transcript_876/m.2308 type:complete len:818 (+) Transcript_876:65-2518(+)
MRAVEGQTDERGAARAPASERADAGAMALPLAGTGAAPFQTKAEHALFGDSGLGDTCIARRPESVPASASAFQHGSSDACTMAAPAHTDVTALMATSAGSSYTGAVVHKRLHDEVATALEQTSAGIERVEGALASAAGRHQTDPLRVAPIVQPIGPLLAPAHGPRGNGEADPLDAHDERQFPQTGLAGSVLSDIFRRRSKCLPSRAGSSGGAMGLVAAAIAAPSAAVVSVHQPRDSSPVDGSSAEVGARPAAGDRARVTMPGAHPAARATETAHTGACDSGATARARASATKRQRQAFAPEFSLSAETSLVVGAEVVFTYAPAEGPLRLGIITNIDDPPPHSAREREYLVRCLSDKKEYRKTAAELYVRPVHGPVAPASPAKPSPAGEDTPARTSLSTARRDPVLDHHSDPAAHGANARARGGAGGEDGAVDGGTGACGAHGDGDSDSGRDGGAGDVGGGGGLGVGGELDDAAGSTVPLELCDDVERLRTELAARDAAARRAQAKVESLQAARAADAEAWERERTAADKRAAAELDTLRVQHAQERIDQEAAIQHARVMVGSVEQFQAQIQEASKKLADSTLTIRRLQDEAVVLSKTLQARELDLRARKSEVKSLSQKLRDGERQLWQREQEMTLLQVKLNGGCREPGGGGSYGGSGGYGASSYAGCAGGVGGCAGTGCAGGCEPMPSAYQPLDRERPLYVAYDAPVAVDTYGNGSTNGGAYGAHGAMMAEIHRSHDVVMVGGQNNATYWPQCATAAADGWQMLQSQSHLGAQPHIVPAIGIATASVEHGHGPPGPVLAHPTPQRAGSNAWTPTSAS